MKKLLKSQNGFTGVEIAMSLVIFMIFISLISTIFINIYLSFSDAQRNTMATGYVTQLAENIDKMYYADVNKSNIEQVIENMNIPSGYTLSAEVNQYNQGEDGKDLVKTVVIEASYKIGNNTKTVQIERIKSKEILITPNKPKLSSGMVPVKYVTVDDLSGQGYWQITTEDDSTWYNYENKRWANIMLQDGLTVEGNIEVTDENRKSLAGKKVTTLGSMFVWIPRYAYKIPEENLHTSTAGEIDIVFLYSTSDNFVDENGNLAPITNMEGYKIHPSFQNGEENNYANGGWDTELTGYWVAKFEASSSDITLAHGGGDTTELDVKVLPSVPSWRAITINNMFTVCRKMCNSGNIYNLSSNADTHMIKNTEWGAVAYLSQSKYGKNELIWNNPYWDFNSEATLTGNVASVAGQNAMLISQCDSYNEGNGPEGSTTGNVYGVYDMAGGGWDRTAAIVENETAKTDTRASILYNERNTKYVDLYKATTDDTSTTSEWNAIIAQANYDLNTNKYGDAVYETSYLASDKCAWHSDGTQFPCLREPYFARGGSTSQSSDAGIFCYLKSWAGVSGTNSFRPVITIP